MWTPKQKRDKEIPDRGETPRKYPKLRRQIRNVKAEKRETIITILIAFVILVAIPICIIFNPYNSNTDRSNQTIIVFIFALIVIIPIAAGLFSVNRFRKGHDIDISEKKENGGRSDELDNPH